LFHHHGSESQAAAAIQQPVVEQEQEVQGVSAVPPPSSAVSDSPSKATGSPPKLSSSPSKGWFIGGLTFGPRQSTPQSSPTRQRSTKSTKTTTAVVNDRNLPSDNSDVEDSSPSKLKGFYALFSKTLAKQKSKWETRTENNIREITSQLRGNSFDGVSPRRGAMKDVVGPPAAAATTVDLGAGLGSEGQRRGRTVSVLLFLLRRLNRSLGH
jgi:hypothetical protein